ncbi:MAG TPA: HAD family hydrolase [Anaerolineae bacterium]|nr:HAD family hydrolase [Anaerolineae bacterium]
MNWRLKAVLFDLDDTLLENDMSRFGPAYSALLGRSFAPLISPDVMLPALRQSIGAVLRHDDPAVTNGEKFERELSTRTGLSAVTLRAGLDRFCAEDFPRLRALTRPRAEASQVVRQARLRGWNVALATNPMFPASATLQRVEWAGLDERDFDAISTQDNSHACKPNPAFFLALLRAIGAAPGETLMVGDDWRLDIAPAIELGLKTFWIRNRDDAHPDGSRPPDAIGTWKEFVSWWNHAWLSF